ncbi:hypothetical protein NQZ79_g2293 [Umbelopsis isabellina]|nr:hypothetical protein NQZ79_g2293 [Umbelopsis isabellina]
MSKGNLASNTATSIANGEALSPNSTAERIPNYHLVDIEGKPVEEHVDYILEIYGQPDDVLKLDDLMEYETLYATYRLNLADKIIVRYSIIDGIHFLTYGNHYFQVCEDGYCVEEVVFAEDLPDKKKTLEFHVTKNNTFKIAKWGTDSWLKFHKMSLNHSWLSLNVDEKVAKDLKPLELLLRKDTKDDLISNQLNDHFEIQRSSDPLTRAANFQLLDIEGNPVEQNVDYCLEMYNMDDDILKFVFNYLSATMYHNYIEELIVQCSIINGIYYLVYKNKYFLSVGEGDEGEGRIFLSTELPKKDQRLQFHVTENNTFKTVQWNKHIYLSYEMITCGYTHISFNGGTGDVGLFLKRYKK